jgi:hypothetical protein
VVLLGVSAFTVSLLVLLVMAIRLDRRAKAEAALPLLREVGIHMLLNRPFQQGVNIPGETEEHAHARSVIGTHLKRVDEGIAALKIR